MTTIRIGNHDIAIECLPLTSERDPLNPAIAAQTEPLPLTDWPLSAAEIADHANRRLVEACGNPDRRDDCAWALGQISLDNHMIRPATTAAQRAGAQRGARRAHRSGELS